MSGRARAGLVLGLILLAGALGASLLLESDPSGRVGPPQPRTIAEGQADIPFSVQQQRVRVEVLNGAGDVGAAAQVTEYLRDAGFDVKTYGNASGFDYEATVVLDRSGLPGAAEAVAGALNGAALRQELDPELYLDATVILGSDWRSTLTAPGPEPR